MIALARAAWEYFLLIVGFAMLGLICSVWAVVAFVLMLVLPSKAARYVGRLGAMWGFRIYLATMTALGLWRLDLRELDSLKDEGALIVAPNHPGLLDAVLIVSRLPNAVCVMKRSILGNFFFGPAAILARYVRNDSLLRLVARAGDELRLGGQLVLFPEGTRSTREPIGPFTEAVGALSRRAGVPVQTVLIEEGTRFLGKGHSLLSRRRLPLSYRVRLGRRFDPPRDVRAFTVELERYFSRELSSVAASTGVAEPESRAVEEAPHVRG